MTLETKFHKQPWLRLLDDIERFAASSSDRPTVPIPETTSREVVGLPPPPALPGRHDRIKGAEWLANRILNTELGKRLQAELSPELFGELIKVLHSRPNK